MEVNKSALPLVALEKEISYLRHESNPDAW